MAKAILAKYARLEYAYYKMCCDAGIRMKHSELKRFDTCSHFITERFDRTQEGKVHMQSLAASKGVCSPRYPARAG